MNNNVVANAPMNKPMLNILKGEAKDVVCFRFSTICLFSRYKLSTLAL